MGKKKDKAKKGKGAEKTALKTEKKASKKAKKLLHEKGEEDIESLIAEFQKADKKQKQVTEIKVDAPSPRCNLSITPNLDKEELILFGGEYFNGSKTFMYNDLLFFNTRTHEWTQVKAPNAPPPRCSHQAVYLRQEGGQLWVFGGEFASPTQSQFYHYRDLWVYHLKEKRWTNVNVPGGPSSRSGHRMAALKRNLVVFGGFHDNIRDYKYFNDVHIFSTETFTWSKLDVLGSIPSPRSGLQMVANTDQTYLLVYGGYSKERIKKDIDKGCIHTDMFKLAPDTKSKEEDGPVRWRWQQVKQYGVRPSARCGFSMSTLQNNTALLFGGVVDEEDEENVEGQMFNEMYSLDLDKATWHPVVLRGKKDSKERKKRRKKKKVPTATLR